MKRILALAARVVGAPGGTVKPVSGASHDRRRRMPRLVPSHPTKRGSPMLAKLLVKLSSVVAISSACGVWKVS